jgi:hypothetical protein
MISVILFVTTLYIHYTYIVSGMTYNVVTKRMTDIIPRYNTRWGCYKNDPMTDFNKQVGCIQNVVDKRMTNVIPC